MLNLFFLFFRGISTLYYEDICRYGNFYNESERLANAIDEVEVNITYLLFFFWPRDINKQYNEEMMNRTR